MFVICKQVKKKVFVTNKSVLAKKKERCDFTQWLGLSEQLRSKDEKTKKKAVQQVALKF